MNLTTISVSRPGKSKEVPVRNPSETETHGAGVWGEGTEEQGALIESNAFQIIDTSKRCALGLLIPYLSDVEVLP